MLFCAAEQPPTDAERRATEAAAEESDARPQRHWLHIVLQQPCRLRHVELRMERGPPEGTPDDAQAAAALPPSPPPMARAPSLHVRSLSQVSDYGNYESCEDTDTEDDRCGPDK